MYEVWFGYCFEEVVVDVVEVVEVIVFGCCESVDGC